MACGAFPKGKKKTKKSDLCSAFLPYRRRSSFWEESSRPGNEVAGPRGERNYLYTRDYKELGEINEIDFTKGRIQEVLQACQILHEQGEHVDGLEVSIGPTSQFSNCVD
ncbi:MAG: hypothetical protein ACLTKE_06015 [Coprococcus sp.]